jgi:hypothetical protein
MKNKKNDFGLPKVGYTPMDTAQMEGMLFKNMAHSNKKRPLIKIGIIGLSLLIFIIPSSAIIYNQISFLIFESKYPTTDIIETILYSSFALIFLTVGIKIIYSNIKK